MSGLFPDSGWLNALTFPARISAGLFVFSLLALTFDYFGLLNLADIWILARPLLIIIALLFGSLSLTALVGIIYDAVMQRRKVSLLGTRREMRRIEAKSGRAEYEATVLKRLDYLSAAEIHFVADALRKNEQSFLAYMRSPPVSNLIAKQLVNTPGGEHHQDYYPFYFVDFAWAALLQRKDEFIAKDDENKRREAEEEARGARRR